MAQADAASGKALETGTQFVPRFDKDGLMGAIVADAATGDVLMFAFMNQEALSRTLESGEVHFWSRSRKALWRKGESSGNVLHLVEARTDCDQDCLLLRVRIGGDQAACHTGRRSCFYRRIEQGTAEGTPPSLSFIDD
jgi:phosphoribosyl-AMP cyclohydrolase